MAVRKLEGIKDNIQLADKYEEKKVKSWPVIVDPKVDGVRVIARTTLQEVFFASRNGNEYPSLSVLAPEVRKAYNFLRQEFPETQLTIDFDGEAKTLEEFNTSTGQIRRHYELAHNADLFLFDLPLIYKTAIERRRMLEYVVNNAGIEWGVKNLPWSLCDDDGMVQRAYKKYRDEGFEGAMVKDPNAYYMFKRTRAWMKVKPKETFECRITGKYEGKGKYVGMLGGWYCEVLDGDHKVCGTAKVGGGFLDHERESFWYQDHTGRIIEASAQEKTPDGSLRHPNFLKFRDDL